MRINNNQPHPIQNGLSTPPSHEHKHSPLQKTMADIESRKMPRHAKDAHTGKIQREVTEFKRGVQRTFGKIVTKIDHFVSKTLEKTEQKKAPTFDKTSKTSPRKISPEIQLEVALIAKEHPWVGKSQSTQDALAQTLQWAKDNPNAFEGSIPGKIKTSSLKGEAQIPPEIKKAFAEYPYANAEGKKAIQDHLKNQGYSIKESSSGLKLKAYTSFSISRLESGSYMVSSDRGLTGGYMKSTKMALLFNDSSFTDPLSTVKGREKIQAKQFGTQQEATIAKALGGKPGIVDVHATDVLTGRSGSVKQTILTGFCSKGDLEHAIHSGETRQNKALFNQIASGVASGLQEMEKMGIVHHDLRAANILLDEEGKTTKAVITDFGLARGVNEPPSKTSSLRISAPERWMMDLKDPTFELSTKHDIYSLGCVLYQSWTGEQVPWAQEWAKTLSVNPYQLKEDIKNYDPGHYPTFNKNNPTDWRGDLIRRCLDPNPQKRPTPDEILKIIDSHKDDIINDPPPTAESANSGSEEEHYVDTSELLKNTNASTYPRLEKEHYVDTSELLKDIYDDAYMNANDIEG